MKKEEKAKILITVIPFVLIILILAITLLVSGIKNAALKRDNEELQESIKEYADSNLTEKREESPESEDAMSAANLLVPQEQNGGEPEDGAASQPGEADKGQAPDQKNVSGQAADAGGGTVSGQDVQHGQGVMEYNRVNYDKVTFDKNEQLKEMMTYWADNNQKALDDLAGLERFMAMSWRLRGTKDFYYYGDLDGNGRPNGTGIAVYADNQYYYGQWVNGARNGNGTWIHYHFHVTQDNKDIYTYHQYTGSFKNDLPDGEGSEHYDYNTELFEENVGYNTNLIGTYKEGLVDGEFYLTNLYSDGNVKEWYGNASGGSWIYQNENKDPKGRRPVLVEDRNPDNYIWLSPSENRNIGVRCLISAYKN